MDAICADDLARVLAIEATDGGVWWTPTLDRGAGAPLHTAAGAGALSVTRHLLDTRRVPVNQRDSVSGATPLHWAAAAAHDRGAGAMAAFGVLLARGGDPDTRALRASSPSCSALPPTPIDAAVAVGHGWAPGEVRARLAEAVAAASSIAKRPVVPAPSARVAPAGAALLAAWSARPPSPPPLPGWRPPTPAGWAGAQGVRRVTAAEGWRPAGSPGDGWARVRPATAAELAARAAAVAAVVE